MSIVIMSRKVKAKQNLSNKNDGFSLKGTRRNLRNIGSDCKNSSVRTIFRGSEPVGHGANRSSGYPVNILHSNCGIVLDLLVCLHQRSQIKDTLRVT